MTWLKRRGDLAAATALLAAILLFFGRRAWHGMRFGQFGDETLHFVGAQVLAGGGLLYRDFMELHGPVAFALPQLYGALFGWAEPLNARIIPISLTLCAACAIASSAALRGAWERMLAPAIFLGLIATIWVVQTLNMVDYQPEAGAMLLIGFALLTFPAWLDVEIGAASLFIAGFCLALTCFVALSYGPAAVLFAGSGAWALIQNRRGAALKFFTAGGCGAVILMLIWLARYADLRGYLALHFVENLVDFRPYQTIDKTNALTILWHRVQAFTLVETMGTAACLIALAVTVACIRNKHWMPLLLGIAGLILTNPRGNPIFQNAAYMITAFGFMALALTQLPRRAGFGARTGARIGWVAAMAVMIIGAEATARRATTSIGNYTRKQMHHVPFASLAQSDDPWAQHIRQVTAPNERVLALPYWPDLYPLAGRLPMERYVYYLPWDADYAKHPALGVTHDICIDLPRDPPPVIYYNGWTVWGKYDPAKYMACLLPILAEKYRPMPGAPYFFVRTDRMARLKP